MSPKSLALIAVAVAVMGMGVYLFVQVRSTPAQAQVSATTPPPERPSPPPPPPAATPPAPTPSPSGAVPTPTPRLEGRPIAVGNTTTTPQAMAAPPEATPRYDSMMELANKAYDSQDFDQATAIAGKVLSKDPTNTRMLRIMISANCIGGDATVAQQYYERLPPKSVDREQMKSRCDRYQVTLKD